MTYFLNFRVQNVGGAVVDPYLLEGDGTADPPALRIIPSTMVPVIVAGKNLLFATHGFNVSYRNGACSLGLLDKYLNLAASNLFIGMLWPGDAWLPVLDYPFEGGVAVDCGRRLAGFCNRGCTGAQSLSFASHSLGARLVLEAIARLERKAQSVCLAAAAINKDCLAGEYSAAAKNSDAISILASHEDYVLKIAFGLGTCRPPGQCRFHRHSVPNGCNRPISSGGHSWAKHRLGRRHSESFRSILAEPRVEVTRSADRRWRRLSPL
jgi:hypothetical protein